MDKIRILLVFIFFTIIAIAQAQENVQSSISGTIKDGETKENLIGVSVYVEEIKGGAATDENGKYKIKLGNGKYNLTISYIGYKTIKEKVEIKNSKPVVFNLTMEPDNQELEEVIVTGRKPDANISEALMSAQKLHTATIKKIPPLMGEVDVVKAIQLLPGVQSASEGSSNFSVRGGGTDQNLIMLDDAIIYNPSHMMGFFSVFNNDAISEATLIKGDIPATYGGRLSSVLDIQTRENTPKKISGNGGIGLISSRLMLEAPLFHEKTTVMVAGRRTYADLFLPLGGEDFEDTYLYFYDLNAKITHKINDNNRIYISGYLGKDNFGMDELAGFGFGNMSLSTKWKHIFSKSLYSNLEINGTSYYNIRAIEMKPFETEFKSDVKDWNLRYDMTKIWSQKNTSRFGISGTYHRFNIGDTEDKGRDDVKVFDDSTFGYRKALDYALYFSHEQNITKRLTLKYGLRLSMFQNIGSEKVYHFDDQYRKIDSTQYGKNEIFNTKFNPEPRIGALYKLDAASSIKASYSRTVQYAQIASNSTGGLPFDLWIPSNPNIKPQKCDQWVIGYFRNFFDNKVETSVEVYYKSMKNLIDFKDHANLFGNAEIDGDIRSGKGRAYGAEFLVRKNVGKVTGWVSYTYSRTYRTIEGINFGEEYLSPYDRPHNFVCVLSFDWTKRFSISANWIFNSGQPVTYPFGKYTIDNTPYAVYTGYRNKSRYPSYHRLDLSATLKTKPKKWKKWEGEWNFSLYNAYGNHNTWAVIFSPDENNMIKTERLYLFTFVPSVSYNFKF
ncbi:MAG TPA: TonB-dependent receptor [Paludibacteraceae bacterium]|nr:TonB-dependent receptor [Paludibacteraceae bacterium]HOU68261.1 TonB-dependent receptor [Paludibacteraceae bacterium]HPH62835.1 TonB-dependent receptor [Paludibacteraceae bacterium]HQF50110.1 TonB-dependent receptor [Paludibacteraceae bacterium]